MSLEPPPIAHPDSTHTQPKPLVLAGWLKTLLLLVMAGALTFGVWLLVAAWGLSRIPSGDYRVTQSPPPDWLSYYMKLMGFGALSCVLGVIGIIRLRRVPSY